MKLKQIISSSKRRLRGAFTLMEASVGMGVLGTITIALISGFTTGFFTMQLARENLRATQIMLEKMETIRLYSWDQVNTPGFVPTTFTAPYDPNAPEGQQGLNYHGTMLITNTAIGASYDADMRLVKVSLSWITGNLSRSRDFTTYITRNGLQSYIY